MKPNTITIALLLAFGSSQAVAAGPCPTTTPPALNGQAIRALVSNKYGCAARGNERWNELHQGSGLGPHNVQDYKRGPNDPVDPTKVVGTYTITDNGPNSPGTILYNYGPTAQYRYVVKEAPSGIPGQSQFWDFCNVANSAETFRVGITPNHC